MHDDDKKQGAVGDFAPLLQGRDAWWHFLEAKSQDEAFEPDTAHVGDEPRLELQDVGRMAQRHAREKRPSFQVAETQSLRCDQCAAQVPADLTFCVYCGAAPRFLAAMRWQLLIVEQIEDRDVLEEVSCILEQGNDELSAREIRHALGQPPAVFYFHGRDEHAAALVDRLFEIGIHARTSYASNSDVLMTREVVESVVRNPAYIAMWVVLGLIWAVGAFFFSPLIALAGFLLTGLVLGYVQSSSYRTRYELNVTSVLNALTGFDPAMAQQAVHTLGKLKDESIKELLTVSLMEYYAIWRHLSAAPIEVRPLLSEVKENLDDLLVQILGSCTKYAELHGFVERSNLAKVRRKLEELHQAAHKTYDATTLNTLHAQIEELERHAHTIQDAQRVLDPFAQRLHCMLANFEALRTRVALMTMRSSSQDHHEDLVHKIMLDLDTELGSFEEALDVVIEPSTHYSS